jgi:hypothetical protein
MNLKTRFIPQVNMWNYNGFSLKVSHCENFTIQARQVEFSKKLRGVRYFRGLSQCTEQEMHGS